MGKLVIAISAAVTAFIMALTAGAIYAYRTMSTSTTTTQAPVSQVSAPLQLAALPTAAPTDVPNVSAQDAAALAAKFLDRTDLYSVELADMQGAQTYKVTFTAGNVVYVGLQGQIVASVLPPTPVPAPVITYSGGGSSGGGGHHGGGGGGEGEGEGGD